MPEVLVQIEMPDAPWADNPAWEFSDKKKTAYLATFLRESGRKTGSQHVGPKITLLARDSKTDKPREIGSVTIVIDDDGHFKIMDDKARTVIPSFAANPDSSQMQSEDN